MKTVSEFGSFVFKRGLSFANRVFRLQIVSFHFQIGILVFQTGLSYRNSPPGQGRPPIPARKVLEGIFYVLRTGCQWKAVPKVYGCASSIHRYYQEWVKAGFFQKIWALGLEKYDELEGIGWKWQSLDGCMVKAPLAQETVGHSPTDRGKNGHKAERPD